MLMSRASLSFTLVLVSSLVAACGGGGGDNGQNGSQNSGTDQGATIAASSAGPSAPAAASSTSAPGSCSDSLASDQPVTVSYDELPYCDPYPLEEMMALDDAAYQNQLSNHWTDVESLLYRYVPPNVTVYPAPRNFSGAMSACLQQHGLLACREYMNLLIGLNKGKQQ